MPDQSLSLRQLLINPDGDSGYHQTITVSRLLKEYTDNEGTGTFDFDNGWEGAVYSFPHQVYIERVR